MINYIKANDKFPSYSEALHLFDLANQIKFSPMGRINENVGKKELVYIDVTQFVKQGFQTGIQRVVNVFVLFASEHKFIFFKNGFYYEFTKFDLPKLQKRSRLVLFLEKVYKFLFKLTYSNNLQKYSKKIRDSIFTLLYSGIKKVDIDDLLSASLFIPDLPSERSHLEAILSLGSFTHTKLSLFVHDLIPLTHPELMPANSTNEFNVYAKILLTADKIFCASNFVKVSYFGYRKMHREFNINQRIYVMPFPQFLLDKNNELQVVSRSFRKLLESSNFVLAVGTILPRKNLSLLVRVLQVLENKNINCDLVVLAHSNWRDQGFELACKTLKFNKVSIYYNSNDAELIYAYKKSLAVGFPSLAEGFGLPVMESLSYNKVTFVNNIEPMKSLSLSKNLRKLENRAVTWADEIEKIINTKDIARKSGSGEVSNMEEKNLLEVKQNEWVRNLLTHILN